MYSLNLRTATTDNSLISLQPVATASMHSTSHMIHAPTEIDLIQIQYELAMSIGTSLELNAMLKTVMDTFLRKLNCAAGCVYEMKRSMLPGDPLYAMPRNLDRNSACSVIQRIFPTTPSLEQQEELRQSLPMIGGDEANGYHYIFDLPDFGFFILTTQGHQLDPLLLQSFKPLLKKLAGSCRACLQNQQLERTYRQASLERNMLHTLIENTPIIAFAVDRDGTFLVSEGFGLKALGREPGEVVGQSIFQLYEDSPEILERVHRALDGTPQTFTVQLAGLSFDARYEPVTDETGAVLGFVGIAHDITERQTAQETLAAILDNVGEGIVTVDAFGTILTANKEIERIFHHTHADLVGTSLEGLLAPADRPVIQSAIKAYHETGESTLLGQRVELLGARADGSTFPLEFHVTETQVIDRKLFAASMRDISHSKQLEQMRDEFIGNISHELRTPLASIMGWTETLLSERPGALNDLQRRFLGINYKSAQRLNELVEEILTASRIQQGALNLDLRPVSPAEAISNSLDAVAEMATSRGIELQVDNFWPAPATVIADLVRMEQVITNLLSNAIKFSADQSSIQVTSSKEGESWQLVVADQGIGIPLSEQEKLFQRFYRASNATAAQIQGTGLGLFVCKAIIDCHGGSIQIESTEGQGSTIRIRIPIRQ